MMKEQTVRAAAVLLAIGVVTAATGSGCGGSTSGSGASINSNSSGNANGNGNANTDAADNGTASDAAPGSFPNTGCGCPPSVACKCPTPTMDASAASCTLSGSAYDHSCQSDSDCVAVFLGNVCDDACRGACPSGAINVRDDARYNADLNVALPPPTPNMGVACSCAFGPGSSICRAGACTLPSGVGPQASDAGDARGSPDAGEAGTACTSSTDCSNGEICGFRQADGCAAKGSCFPAPGAVCLAYSPGCACDGSEISVACTGLPSGYDAKPLLHTGVCASDAGGAG